MIRASVTGANGRMGSLIISNILGSKDIQLVAAIDTVNIGMDAGEAIHAGKVGVPITAAAELDSVLARTKPDVLIDFTVAAAVVGNVQAASKNRVNLIVGTTGYSPEQYAQMERAIRGSGKAAVISPNFAVGVNVFYKIVESAGAYLRDFDAEIIEMHHNKKLDAPSGTAKKAAEVISAVRGGKEFVYGRKGHSPRKDEIGIHAVRGGDIVGDHLVLFAGDGERIELKHQAHSRQAFAGGAIRAARWVVNAKPGIYGMNEVLGL